MKRLKQLTAALLAAATMLSAAAFTAYADSKYMRGDANNDNLVNINDVTKVQRVLAGMESKSLKSVTRSCDVDGDGLNIKDVTEIQRYLAMYDNQYKIGKIFRYDEYELPFIPA